jgi:hypothetical protein
MELNILKNLSVSALILFFIGCEDIREPEGRDENSPLTVFVSVEYVPSIELNEYSWQTIKTISGHMSSDIFDVTHTRIMWQSDMFWLVYDTTGYFKVDCRTCETGMWYGTDGSTELMTYDFHTMSPVTNQVSLVNSVGVFGNVLAPVSAMKGDAMWLWWTINNAVIDSMLIVLE